MEITKFSFTLHYKFSFKGKFICDKEYKNQGSHSPVDQAADLVFSNEHSLLKMEYFIMAMISFGICKAVMRYMKDGMRRL